MSCVPMKLNNGFFTEDILNSGLDYAMDFGKNWLLPIQERLKNKYIFLTEESLNEYDLLCREAMNYGHNFIQQTLLKLHDDKATIKEVELKRHFINSVSNKYLWVNKSNLSKLFSQGCYYAWKDGLDDCIK